MRLFARGGQNPQRWTTRAARSRLCAGPRDNQAESSSRARCCFRARRWRVSGPQGSTSVCFSSRDACARVMRAAEAAALLSRARLSNGTRGIREPSRARGRRVASRGAPAHGRVYAARALHCAAHTCVRQEQQRSLPRSRAHEKEKSRTRASGRIARRACARSIFSSFPRARGTHARDASHRDGGSDVACGALQRNSRRTWAARASINVAKRACARSCLVFARNARPTCARDASHSDRFICCLWRGSRASATHLWTEWLAYLQRMYRGSRRPTHGAFCRSLDLWRLSRWTPSCMRAFEIGMACARDLRAAHVRANP